jgi:hypothetical protein
MLFFPYECGFLLKFWTLRGFEADLSVQPIAGLYVNIHDVSKVSYTFAFRKFVFISTENYLTLFCMGHTYLYECVCMCDIRVYKYAHIYIYIQTEVCVRTSFIQDSYLRKRERVALPGRDFIHFIRNYATAL